MITEANLKQGLTSSKETISRLSNELYLHIQSDNWEEALLLLPELQCNLMGTIIAEDFLQA